MSLFLSDYSLNQGTVKNVTIKNVVLDRVNIPIHLYQTNGGHSYVGNLLLATNNETDQDNGCRLDVGIFKHVLIMMHDFGTTALALRTRR